MSADEYGSLRLNVDVFELGELRSYLDDSSLTIDRDKPSETHGEPVTIAVIILAPIAIRALTAWLTKNREKGEICFESEIRHPDGSSERKRLCVRRSSSTTEPEVLKQLQETLKLDPEIVRAAASLGK
jgi:hypothetical protein